ncbi:hypothetical protein HUJ04_000405 [Dendroctonus ponderosae]|nr:hypothetical protein HUJ04_000405 [Dendroctonus ponderosae]
MGHLPDPAECHLAVHIVHSSSFGQSLARCPAFPHLKHKEDLSGPLHWPATWSYAQHLKHRGVLAAVPLAFVLPAFCYLRLEEGRIFDRNKLPALGVAFFGLSVTTLGVIFLFMDIDQINQCSHGVVMDYCSLRYLNVTQNSTEI